jgi:hypothetical protein
MRDLEWTKQRAKGFVISEWTFEAYRRCRSGVLRAREFA